MSNSAPRSFAEDETRANSPADLMLSRGAFEEIRGDPHQVLHRIDEDKIAELIFADQPPLNQLVGLLEDVAHVRHVPMADIRTIDRVKLLIEGRAVGTESQRIQRVVALASKEE